MTCWQNMAINQIEAKKLLAQVLATKKMVINQSGSNI
jgi:hypothetical protein